MKTAAELNTIGERICWAVEHGRAGEVISELKVVQLDAIKEGMKRAAEIARWKHPISSSAAYYEAKHTTEAILTAANQLKEKDIYD